MKTLPLSLLLLSAPAWATKPTPAPEPSQNQAQNTAQDQAQTQHQSQYQTVKGGHTESESASQSGAASTSDSGGNQLGVNSDFRSLALALPGLTPSPAGGDCQITTASKGAFGIGASGRIKYAEECLAFQQCVALADRYAAWGQVALAVQQLEQCGGLQGAVIAPVTEPAPVEYVTREEMERVFRVSQGK